jgi:sugar transferase (PEP-CTERM/EpsH1 system associated)
MRRYEIEIADDFQHSIFITENEKQLFQSFAQNKEVSAIANGVDLKYYCPDKNVNTNHGTDIVFTGAMDYFANVDAVTYFARDIFPLVKRQVPDAKFYIVGGNPAKAVRKLGRNGSIKITGFVNDARDYLRMASVCIVPLRIARGVQNKILEAMAMGRPVVATSKTAQNLDVHSGEDIFIEDEPERFGLRVVELLKDKELRERIGANARKTIEKKYNWQVNLHKLEQILLKEYDS